MTGIIVLISITLLFVTATPGDAGIIPVSGPPESVVISAFTEGGPAAYSVEIQLDSTGPLQYVAPGVGSLDLGEHGQLTGFTVNINQDPLISYGIAVTDFGAPSTFGFSFSTPITPMAGGSQVAASISGSVTEGSGGTVTITPATPAPGIPQDGPDLGPLPDEMQVFTLSADSGASYVSAGIDIGPAYTSPQLFQGASASIPAVNVGYVAGPGGGPWNAMRLDLNFTLSGGGDVATINGAGIIIPDPATWVILAIGMIAVTGVRR